MNYFAHDFTDPVTSSPEVISLVLRAHCHFCKDLKDDCYRYLDHYICDECCWAIAAEGGW